MHFAPFSKFERALAEAILQIMLDQRLITLDQYDAIVASF